MMLSAMLSILPCAIHSDLRSPNPIEPFALNEVKLTGGVWLKSFEKEQAYILSREPERFLHNFRKNAGLEPQGKIYGGWEDGGLAGHTLGHYMTACAQAYVSTGDKRFKGKLDAIIKGLAECQAHRPDGMISAIPSGEKPWEDIRKGEIRSGGFDLNGMWSPWYTHHKVLVGLLDAYTLAGSKEALPIAQKFADWMINLTKDLTDEQWAKMLRCEYGGMNEGLARLYELTKDERYLKLAHKFMDAPFFDPLTKQEDKLSGIHSNTQIPKVLGLARLSEIKDGGNYRQQVKFFWDTVIDHHTYVIGGNGDHEYFTQADRLDQELTTNTCETCCTYNMLKLTRNLFEWQPDARYADYYERAHLNHILPSQNPETGMVTYFFPLLSGTSRSFSDPDHDFSCCHGSGLENHTKHQDSVYFHRGTDTLYVAQYVPTELHWGATGLALRQETDYPQSGTIKFKVLGGAPKPITLALRHPGWAQSSFPIKVNGRRAVTSSKPGAFTELKRKWKTGDTIEFTIPMSVRTEPILGNPKKVALLYGPTVLAADLGSPDQPMPQTPVLVPGTKLPAQYVSHSAPNTFIIKGAARPHELTLRPLYQIVNNRYAIYFDQFGDAEWAKFEAEYRSEEKRIKELNARTLDLMRVGEMQPERDHKLTSESCDVREANGKGFRTPMGKGFFEFELKVDSDKPMALVVTYWVGSRPRNGGVILVDGEKLAENPAFGANDKNLFVSKTIEIPSGMTHGKTHIKVRFATDTHGASSAISEVRCIHK